MARYDLERFRDDIIKIVQDNMPAKVAQINAEKADGDDIEAPDNSLYIFDIMDAVLNAYPFIYYGFDNVVTDGTVGQTKTTVTLFISVVFDNANNTSVINQALRYTRALKEIIEEHQSDIAQISVNQVSQFAPDDFQLNNGANYKIGGILIEGTMIG